MSGQVDFHVHSDRSCDGDYSPQELIRMAADREFKALSISDHDTVAAYPEAVEMGMAAGVEVIPGIEVTTLFDGREFHLLLPFVNWENDSIGEIIDRQTRFRTEEATERVERLRSLGFSITWEEVRSKSNGIPPLGVKIAQVLLENPANGHLPSLEFFRRQENRDRGPYLFYKEFFARGKPAFVDKKYIDLFEALAVAPETGGVPVLAHPGAYFQRTTSEDARVLRAHGLVGLEVYASYHTPAQVDFYRALAEETGLIPTAGSDFHGRIKPHVSFGSIEEGQYWMVEKLRSFRGGEN